MRMWMVNPTILCSSHLLGEHAECHMIAGTINKYRWNVLRGLVDIGAIELCNLRRRHDELANEMKRRGMNHASPLPEYEKALVLYPYSWGLVVSADSWNLLSERCPECRKRAVDFENAGVAHETP